MHVSTIDYCYNRWYDARKHNKLLLQLMIRCTLTQYIIVTADDMMYVNTINYCYNWWHVDTIQLMTFDEIDTMIYQPKSSDSCRGQRLKWLSLLGLINIVATHIKSQLLFYLSSIIYQLICTKYKTRAKLMEHPSVYKQQQRLCFSIFPVTFSQHFCHLDFAKQCSIPKRSC
jgi:hypothetical protein